MDLGRTQATRGFGFLENWLARLRAKKVSSLITDKERRGRILDFGCGSYPYFLLACGCQEKFGLDKSRSDYSGPGLEIKQFDFAQAGALPFPDNYFDLVTALAVAEHLSEETARHLWPEIYRVLAAGGRLVITTPAEGTGKILELMAHLKLASAEEVADHKQYYNERRLAEQLSLAGFSPDKIKLARFECGVNLLARAEK